jgi:hypothetical protein
MCKQASGIFRSDAAQGFALRDISGIFAVTEYFYAALPMSF